MNPIYELIQEFFEPLDSTFTESKKFPAGSFGRTLIHRNQLATTNPPSPLKIALLGIPENRGTLAIQTHLAPNFIRKQLYQLFSPQLSVLIADMGNLRTGQSLQDTYYAIKIICAELINNGILPIILGGGQDLTYGQFLGCQELGYPLNLTSIDSKIDLQVSGELNSRNYLHKIITDHGNELFNFVTLGIQRYLVSQKDMDLMNKLFFDGIRLGEIRENQAICEPFLRDSDIISIDMSGIRFADNPGAAFSNPNGLTADEICQLAWYAGYSDRVKTLGIYEMDPSSDQLELSAQLASQIIWHFIDAFSSHESRKSDTENIEKLMVSVEIFAHSIVFRHDVENNRWWFELPMHQGEIDNFLLISCSEDDYQQAMQGEVPDKLWRNYQKIN